MVRCRRRGETLRIDICDTGPGIPEDQRISIFGESYQLVRSGAGRLCRIAWCGSDASRTCSPSPFSSLRMTPNASRMRT